MKEFILVSLFLFLHTASYNQLSKGIIILEAKDSLFNSFPSENDTASTFF
ncbi:hypothetical protein ACE38F_22475 [Bacillus mycoides]